MTEQFPKVYVISEEDRLKIAEWDNIHCKNKQLQGTIDLLNQELQMHYDDVDKINSLGFFKRLRFVFTGYL